MILEIIERRGGPRQGHFDQINDSVRKENKGSLGEVKRMTSGSIVAGKAHREEKVTDYYQAAQVSSPPPSHSLPHLLSHARRNSRRCHPRTAKEDGQMDRG